MLFSIANFMARWTRVFKSMKKSRFLVFLVYKANFADDWGLVKRFTFASLVVMLIGIAGIGWWVGEKIKTGVIKEATTTTALYMDSFIAPNLQELSQSDSITPEHFEALNNLFSENNLGQQTVTVKVWNSDYRVIYSNNPLLVGKVFPATDDLVAAWGGAVTGEISSLQEAENIEERRASYSQLIEIYSPVRLNDTNKMIAVVEFYQTAGPLEDKIIAAQRRSWLIVGMTMTAIYLLLVGFVQWANNTIEQQESVLKNQVTQLTQLLSQNSELNKRVRRAAANTTALNESLLRRISAELHDGPVQEISLALLRLDSAMSENEICRLVRNSKCSDNLPIIQTALQTALQEMRAIAASLGLPQLDNPSLPEILARVVRSHEKRTGTKVTLIMGDLPEQTSLPIKITVYRLIQEGLNNAYRHAGGAGQEVRVNYKSNQIQVEVSDQGPGFDIKPSIEWDEQLGLAGIRERVESLGGLFTIESKTNEGTKLSARLFLQNIGDNLYG